MLRESGSTANGGTTRRSKRAFVIEYLRSFNLFSSYPPSTSNYDIQRELISTRVFLLLLTLCILILAIYTSQERVTQTITVTSPTFDQFRDLIQRYPATLNCPCGDIAIMQNTFISLYPDFHQVCSSDFVSSQWIMHINAAAGLHISIDFSYTGGPLFQALATFCNLTKSSLHNSLLTFNSTRFISAAVLPEEFFIRRVQSLIDAFKTEAIEAFLQPLNMVREMTHSNSLMSSLLTNAKIFVGSFLLAGIYFEHYNNGTCNCFLTPSCRAPLTRQVPNSNMLFTIPGLYIGCYLVEAMRSSSLECFYNQSCLEQIESSLRSPMSFNETTLDPSRTRFAVNSTVDTLLSQAMVERWNEDISWMNYYKQCKPATCTYSFASKYNIWYMITTIIGLIGGLMKVLRFAVPLAIKFIQRRICGVLSPPSTVEPEYTPWLKKLINFNIFQSIPPSTDQAEIRKQVISTRVFIYIFLACIVFFLTYLSTGVITTTYITVSPSYNQFLTLYENHHEHALLCPCASLATEYQEILQIAFKLHPYCSSDFVKSPWIDFPRTDSFFDGYEFRLLAPTIFQTLSSYCRLTTNHIQTNLRMFNTTQMVTATALGELEFRARTNVTTSSFITLMINSFLRSVSLITKTIRANGIVSAQATNFYFYVGGITAPHMYNDTWYNASLLNFGYYPRQGCYCLPAVSCPTLMISYYTYPESILTSMKFYEGCLPDEGVRQSSLRAFFDPILVNYMSDWFYFPQNTTKVLNASDLIEFEVESSIEDILSKMMIEQWNLSSFHDIYYEKCRPKTCTYTQVDRRSFLIIFTTLIGLVGGLASVLQIIVPFLVKILFSIHARFTREQQQEQVHFSLKAFMFNLLNKVRQLNLFPSLPPATDETQIKTELISTRVFVLLLIGSVLILTTYSVRTAIVKTKTISSPSVDDYRSLYASHSETLSCPCTQMTIDHSTFLTLHPTFHQVCSSKLVLSRWIVEIMSKQSYIVLTNDDALYDFRLFSGSFFLTIALLCEVVNKTVTDGLINFGSSSIITDHVMPENELNAQGLAAMDLFIVTTTNEFISLLRIIRETSQANALISGYATNIQMAYDFIDESGNLGSVANYMTFLNCSCANSPLCSQEASIYGVNGVHRTPVPGVRIGCYLVEAALQSSLSVVYDQTWIDNFRNWTQSINPYFQVKALNSSLNRNFAINASLESMTQQLMVDEWIGKNVSFSNYYTQCQPLECKYTYMEKNDMIYMITVIISVIGGLKVVFYFVVPRTVTIARKWYLKRRAKVVPITTQIEL